MDAKSIAKSLPKSPTTNHPTLLKKMLDQLCRILKDIDNWPHFVHYTDGDNLPYPIAISSTATTHDNGLFGYTSPYAKKWMIFLLNPHNILYPIVRVPYNDNMILNKYHNIITMMKMIRYPPLLKIQTINGLDPQVVLYDMTLADLWKKYKKKMSANMFFSSSNINDLILDYADIRSYIM